MRKDAVGFFWNDTPPPRIVKEQPKREPPEPTWLDPSYLPGLEEARAFPVKVLSIDELVTLASKGEHFIIDVEVYPNYFLAVFTHVLSGAVFYLEEIDGVNKLDTQMFTWILTTLTSIGFNSISYDMPICTLAAAGLPPSVLWEATKRIIVDNIRGWEVLREYKVKALKCDHIDLIEVAPLQASLKTYAGRLHAHKMQDLPFAPGTVLTMDQITIVRWYCVNDTSNTDLLRRCLEEHVNLRYELSNEYQVDLRSKSDAQIAEAVIGAELKRRTGTRPQKPEIEVGTVYKYRVPPFLQYRTPLMNWALGIVREANFVVEYTGSIGMPEEINSLKLEINGSVYRMGIGGLHSSEQTAAHYTDQHYQLIDKDVTSYYPYIILNLGLAPHHLGVPFLHVYRGIVERRIAAKKAGDDIVAQSLKIVVNGSFGKLGSKYSILYSPDLLIQVTLTGQLSLLMLIERLELAGIPVVSANTDGIVIKCPRHLHPTMDAIVAQWEVDTGFPTEETRYLALFSRDVNNYVAIKQKQDKVTKEWLMQPDGTKNKGAYANPWASSKNPETKLYKNPTATICVEAVEAYLTTGVPVSSTIRGCTDITKFVAVRTVKGGAVKVWEDGPTEYVGKTVRWYYATGVDGELVYAGSGNKVPRSEGARPLMVLPDQFPADVDFVWYETEAVRILRDIGALPPEET